MTYNVFSGTLNPTHFTSLHLTIVLYLLPYTCKALLAEMCRIGDFKGVGPIDAKF